MTLDPVGTSTSPIGWFARPETRRWRAAVQQHEARACHQMLPGYAVTPLIEAPPLATRWNVGRVFVKDEASRFGLPAFKALGASYAIARLLAERAGSPVATSWQALVAQAHADQVTLVTATDGNHGRAVAHFAARLGLACEVLIPQVMSPATANAISGEGATVVRCTGSYDEAVQAAARRADERADLVLVQDTAWPGYEDVPSWIADGYQTMLVEASEQLRALALLEPALVAVPVGVGSLAQAVVSYYRARADGASTAVLACEPDTAACVLASLRAGHATTVDTRSTIMAGLNCGTPTSLGWPIIHSGLDAAVTVTDADARRAIEVLADLGVDAGASGAAALAGVEAALSGSGAAQRRRELGLRDDSVIVLLNTEGAMGAGGQP